MYASSYVQLNHKSKIQCICFFLQSTTKHIWSNRATYKSEIQENTSPNWSVSRQLHSSRSRCSRSTPPASHAIHFQSSSPQQGGTTASFRERKQEATAILNKRVPQVHKQQNCKSVPSFHFLSLPRICVSKYSAVHFIFSCSSQ